MIENLAAQGAGLFFCAGNNAGAPAKR